MKKTRWLLLSSFALFGCNKKAIFDGPHFFEDDFESYSSVQNLLLPNDQRWSFTQLTRKDNTVNVDSARTHSGRKALKFFARKSDGEGASKGSIAKQNMAFWDGETVSVSGWYFIEGTASLQWLFLLDLEEQTAVGAGPGIRLALVDNKLRMEYKFNEKDVVQPAGQEVDFPRNQWVHLTWEVKLSQKKAGAVRLWQNGQIIINSTGNTTLPKDVLYFQQGTKGMYSSCEIGITANSQQSDATIWVDEFKIEKLN